MTVQGSSRDPGAEEHEQLETKESPCRHQLTAAATTMIEAAKIFHTAVLTSVHIDLVMSFVMFPSRRQE